MSTEHPARLASQRSMDAVHKKDKQAWLDNFADDAVVEDPIGVSALDPTGKGQRGKEAIAEAAPEDSPASSSRWAPTRACSPLIATLMPTLSSACASAASSRKSCSPIVLPCAACAECAQPPASGRIAQSSRRDLSMATPARTAGIPRYR